MREDTGNLVEKEVGIRVDWEKLEGLEYFRRIVGSGLFFSY